MSESTLQFQLDCAEERIADLENEIKNRNLFIAAMVAQAGGQVEIEDSTFFRVSHKSILTQDIDRERRLTRILLKE